MRRFTEDEVRAMLSQDHLLNTSVALGKPPGDVTADELVIHWTRFHEMSVVTFNVSEDDKNEYLFV